MANDDIHVVACKILSYLYACLKRKKEFNNEEFIKEIVSKNVKKEYLLDIIKMLCDEGYIDGLTYKKTWGRETVLISDFDEMWITMKGAEYLTSNSHMKRVCDWIVNNTVGMAAEVVKAII